MGCSFRGNRQRRSITEGKGISSTDRHMTGPENAPAISSFPPSLAVRCHVLSVTEMLEVSRRSVPFVRYTSVNTAYSARKACTSSMDRAKLKFPHACTPLMVMPISRPSASNRAPPEEP
jgi:hypothetical protein